MAIERFSTAGIRRAGRVDFNPEPVLSANGYPGFGHCRNRLERRGCGAPTSGLPWTEALRVAPFSTVAYATREEAIKGVRHGRKTGGLRRLGRGSATRVDPGKNQGIFICVRHGRRREQNVYEA